MTTMMLQTTIKTINNNDAADKQTTINNNDAADNNQDHQ